VVLQQLGQEEEEEGNGGDADHPVCEGAPLLRSTAGREAAGGGQHAR
jgi:hypothetical protein